ncbi:MAG: M90 family metallopeptidase [Betaproteobacteria bacterium]
MWNWLVRWHPSRRQRARGIEDALWHATLQCYGFLEQLSASEKSALRELCAGFLAHKRFHGAQGLTITDEMALAITAQACLPLLHLAPGMSAAGRLRWYDDFVGIVLHPHEVVAAREETDDIGVVHQYQEVLSGESMDRGPVMLNWHDVRNSGASAHHGYNLVIHEFAHKLDLRDGQANGCPPLPRGFRGALTTAQARSDWLAELHDAYQSFREQVIKAERFGAPEPWMDGYAAHSPPEFFAVACEAYFVQRERFGQDFPGLLGLFDAFFRPATPAG